MRAVSVWHAATASRLRGYGYGYGCVLALLAVSAGAQSPVPLADRVTEPLLPTGVVPHDVAIDGQLAYLWPTGANQQTIHVVGDFSLTVGDRKLTAQQGIVWMEPRELDGRRYHRFDVFLYRAASAVEPAGTITRGPVLFVTVSSFGDVVVSANRRTLASSENTAVYQDALRVRDQLRAAVPGGGDELTTPAGPLAGVPAEADLTQEVSFAADQTTYSELPDSQPIVVAIGNVVVQRIDPAGLNTLELHADAGVLFLKAGVDGQQVERADDLAGSSPPVEAVYLEGDIRVSLGERNMRASRLLYDLRNDRATILDAVVFGMVPDRNLPLYVRAAEVRMLSQREFSAHDAMLTTSEFHTPHYHIGAERIDVVDRTTRSLSGEQLGLARATYRVEDATFNLYNVPILYWPGSAGKVSLGDSALRGISVGGGDDFGLSVETQWDFFNLLSLPAPEGFDAELRLDYFSKRGPAVGLDLNYEGDDYFGLYRGYLIDDRGDDNLGRFRKNERDSGTRGRSTLRHRQYLPDDWELSVEASYISDPGFLEEYFESEFDEGKEQETLVYLKKQRDNWAFTALGQVRWNDFYTQTERWPDFGFHLIGQPVGDWGTWFSENRAGVVRYRAADQDLFQWLRYGSDGPSSGSTFRGDTRQEIDVPLDLGPLRVVPFLAVRGTAWDDSPDEGGLGRAFATFGVRASAYLSRVYPGIQSRLWDVNGVRHIIKPELVAWSSHSNHDSADLYAFDESVEGIDDFDGAKIGVQQRWQTKRGAPGAERVVDWISLDVEMGAFNDVPGDDLTNGFVSYSRPENSVARNFVNTEFIWRVNDATVLASEMNYDLNDGEVDIFNVSLAVERTPRFSYMVGYRFIEETESNLLGLGMNYRIDEKHAIALREQFDLARGETLDFSIGYVRKFPRWYTAIIFDLDEAEGNVGVSLAIWPEGLPRATVGSRRFTGLATSTAMTNR